MNKLTENEEKPSQTPKIIKSSAHHLTNLLENFLCFYASREEP